MRVKDLIAKLQQVDPDWYVGRTGTTASIHISECSFDEPSPIGARYGWVFMDGRPTKILTARK